MTAKPKSNAFAVSMIAAGLAMFTSPLIAAADRPNIVLIISDDQAWTGYGFMGHNVIETPLPTLCFVNSDGLH